MSDSSTIEKMTSESLCETKEKVDENNNDSVRKTNPILSNKIFIGNINPTVQEKELILLFQRVGTILELKYKWNSQGTSKNQPKGYAFVTMANHDQAKAVYQAYHGKKYKGYNLIIGNANELLQIEKMSLKRKHQEINEISDSVSDKNNANLEEQGPLGMVSGQSIEKNIRLIEKAIQNSRQKIDH